MAKKQDFSLYERIFKANLAELFPFCFGGSKLLPASVVLRRRRFSWWVATEWRIIATETLNSYNHSNILKISEDGF